MQRSPGRREGGLGRPPAPPLNESVTIPKALSDRVIQLIQGIRPGRISEQRRHGIADYVRRLIVKCFQPEHKVEAFMFGSVPLRTYLPDGDIDVSIFCEPKGLQETWCDKLSALLESEAENPEAEYKVANVSLINAEVKLLKCLVDNIVVDVSFNQIGGLCTLNFLEAMDRKIGGKHLFKKSIILIKAWCYYESRVLGAQHSLLSTYALETMVLHIFNVYHSELQTPLEVLYKFLIVFHHFHWEDFCLTLSGPICLKSLDVSSVTAPPDQGKTLLIPNFLNVMLESYSYTPVILANSKGPGYPKYMNIMDPLLHSNNLGRSVSQTSETRIRNAFGHGALMLNQLFKKDLPEALDALNGFFKNTWLAQQRTRHTLQPQVSRPLPVQPVAFTAPGIKSGNGLLELLKDPHKDMSDLHERENGSTLYNIPGFNVGPQVQANGNAAMLNGANLAGIFQPPPPRGQEERSGTPSAIPGRAELDKMGRQVHAPPHMRSLFEIQLMKNEAGQPFSAFAQQPFDSGHAQQHYQHQLLNQYAQMKMVPTQNMSHLARDRSEAGLHRTRSEPNMGDLGLKKKDKNPVKRCILPYQFVYTKNTTTPVPQSADEENKQRTREVVIQQHSPLTADSLTQSKAVDASVRGIEGRKNEKVHSRRVKGDLRTEESVRDKLRLEPHVEQKLNAIDARLRATEIERSGAESSGEHEECIPVESSDISPTNVDGKDDAESPKKTRTLTDILTSLQPRAELHDQSIVIGEPPEPAMVMNDCHRLDRDMYSASRSMIRRPSRPYECHQGMHLYDPRNVFLQMSQNQNQRHLMDRAAMPDRQTQPLLEMGPNGLPFLASYGHTYPYVVNTPQGPQTVCQLLSTQGELPTAQMTPARASGVPPSGARHPSLQKPDGRNALMDWLPGTVPPFQWARSEGTASVPNSRMPGGVPVAPQQAWGNFYGASSGAVPPRPHEELLPRDSDDVLSGDIETLTKQLEVARNFIGCKTPPPSVDRDRSGRSSSSGHTPDKPLSNSGYRRGTPSPTMSSRQESSVSSRERHGRSQLESPSPFSHHGHAPNGTAMGFPGNFAAQPPNGVFQLPAGYMSHPPPPPGGVAERMPAENELLNQLHGNVNFAPAAIPGFNFQGPARGMPPPMTAMMNVGGGGQPPTNMQHALVDPNLQLPPQHPGSRSPGQGNDAQAARNNKATGGCRPMTMDDHAQHISITTRDGQSVRVDASVVHAVKAAMAGSDDHHASKDPNNRTSQADPNSPRRLMGDGARLRGGFHDPPGQHYAMRRELEDGVVYYQRPKDIPAFPTNRLPLSDVTAMPAQNHLVSLFSFSNHTPPTDVPMQTRTGTTPYGTGSFMPLNANYVSEQRKAREQAAEKESQAQGIEGNGVEDCSSSNRSGSNSSERMDQNDNKSNPRGRFSPPNGQQWSTSASSNRSYVHTPPRSYGQPEQQRPVTNVPAETWQTKPDRPGTTNAGDLSDYYKDYGEVANAFVSTDALTRPPSHGGGTLAAHPNAPNYGEHAAVNCYNPQNMHHRHQPQGHSLPHNSSLIMPRNRRDGDRWTHHTRSDKSSIDRSSPESINGHGRLRRGNEPYDKWEGKRLIRNANVPLAHRPLDPFIKAGRDGGSDDDLTQSGRSNIDHIFNPSRQQHFRGPLNQRHHRNRRSSPGDERNRYGFRDTDFPALESARSSKRPSPPSSQSGTPRASDKQNPSISR